MSATERARVLATLSICALAGVGCIETGIQESLKPFDYAAVETAPPPEREPGSIWPGASPSGSFLFFDRKARGIGDLVTVRVLERVSAQGQALTDTSKSSSLGSTLNSDLGFQNLIARPIKWLFRVLGDSDPGQPVVAGVPTNVVESNMDDTFEGEGTTSRSGSFTAIVTCRVVDILPGRIFHIRGRRAVAVNKEMQYLSIEGLVRQQDIGIDNVVYSDALAEARITLDGLGVIDDKQRPGWMTRVLSWLYPF